MTKKLPRVDIRLTLGFEASFDSFKGRTLEEFAELLQQELHEVLNDFRLEDVHGIFSSVQSTEYLENE